MHLIYISSTTYIYILCMFIHVTWWNICITALKLYNGHVVYDKLEHMRNMRASKFYKIKRLQNLGNVYFLKKFKILWQIQVNILYISFVRKLYCGVINICLTLRRRYHEYFWHVTVYTQTEKDTIRSYFFKAWCFSLSRHCLTALFWVYAWAANSNRHCDHSITHMHDLCFHSRQNR